MIFKVYLMRHHGERRPWKDMKNGPFYIGTILSSARRTRAEYVRIAWLMNNSGGRHPEVRDLFEPVLLGFSHNAFQLRGFERIAHPQGAYAAAQEWHVEEPTSEDRRKATGARPAHMVSPTLP